VFALGGVGEEVETGDQGEGDAGCRLYPASRRLA
jgi:hypothetical protein